MSYIHERCVAGNTIEHRYYYTFYEHPRGAKRGIKKNASPDRVKRSNLRKAETDLRRLMNANFKDGDFLVTLDFCKVKKPRDSIEMQAEISNFIRRLKNKFKKLKIVLKYIYVKEIGPKGSRHVHMMLPRCDTELIRDTWRAGGIHIAPLWSNGQYAAIAEYFIKYSRKTEETEGVLVGRRWTSSKNLVKPKVTKRKCKREYFSMNIKEKPGYMIDQDSIRHGVSEITGYEYYSYTYIKILTKRKGG